MNCCAKQSMLGKTDTWNFELNENKLCWEKTDTWNVELNENYFPCLKNYFGHR